MKIFDEQILHMLDGTLVVAPAPAPASGMLNAFTLALLVSTLIVATQRWQGSNSFDRDLKGIQKVHKNPVPRTNGIALLAGILMVPIFGLLEHSIGLPAEDGIGVSMLLCPSCQLYSRVCTRT